MSGPQPNAEFHGEVRRSLTDRDIRYTSGRQAVVTALHMARGPRSAAELNDHLTTIPLSSLYRSLTVLSDGGVLSRHHDTDGLARYELAEWLTGHHHHIICLDCGEVEDISLGAEQEHSLESLASGIASQAGYELEGHVLEVEGLCGECRS